MYDFLKQLILPPASPILLILVGLALARRYDRLGTTLAASGLVAIYIASTPFCGTPLLASLENTTPPHLAGRSAVEPEAIVILSAGINIAAPEYGGPTVDALALQRLRYGARLHGETGLPILVTGGPARDSPITNAALMAKTLLEDFATPVRWLEERATNTFENATLSADILLSSGIDTIYLVTHAWHMPRAREAFEKAGIVTVPAPTGYAGSGPMSARSLVPTAKNLQECQFALHELLGRLWYRLVYY